MINFLTILLCSLPVFSQISSDEVKISFRKSTVHRTNNTYVLETNENLRDNLPKKRSITVDKSYPYIESNSPMFNALFSLAIEETKENMVSTIYDSSFGQDRCDCFETGKKWNYVWTRDIAYSVNLGLASIDPVRSMKSLLFKVSNLRSSNDLSAQIVQDTGSGGSWPISTDRVTWALGAVELIKYLDGSNKRKFIDRAYIALKNTIEADREIIYDTKLGLYRGEQSFLDWREQTYPAWAKENLSHIGMSISLSTNIAHFVALKSLAIIAKENGKSSFKYDSWARELKRNINNHFWNTSRGLYSLMLPTFLNYSQVDKFDLLGNSLAVIHGVTNSSAQSDLLDNYQMVDHGAPVIFPQDKDAPIYHNRAIWPFVTAYALKAAKSQNQIKVYDHLFESLVKGSALNLSNMENFEFLTLKSYVFDADKSGPVLNSQRQLWSVAGFISAYLDGIFGKEISDDRISFNPLITSKMKSTLLSDSDTIELKNFKWKSKVLNVKIHLSASLDSNKESYYLVSSVKLNGNSSTFPIHHRKLKDQNQIDIYMDETDKNFNSITKNERNLFSPRVPSITGVAKVQNRIKVDFSNSDSSSLKFNVYKNGTIFKESLRSTSFYDLDIETTNCYSIEAEDFRNKSFHSEPVCYWPEGSIQELHVNKKTNRIKQDFSVKRNGTYLLQAVYDNTGDITSGITAVVKELEVYDGFRKIHSGFIFMPHNNGRSDSNFIEVNLEENITYTIKMKDAFNMSYFSHFDTYVHRGGRSGKDNDAHIHTLKVLRK